MRDLMARGTRAVAVGMIAGLCPFADAQPEFIELPTPAGAARSDAYAISADGSTVVGSFHLPDGSREPCRWPGGNVVEELGTLAPFPGVGIGKRVNADGSLVIGGAPSEAATCGGNDDVEGFSWTPDAGMTGLGFGAGCKSWANYVSDDGAIVGGGAVWCCTYVPAVQISGGPWQALPASGTDPEYVTGGSQNGAHLIGGLEVAGAPVGAWVYHRLTDVRETIADLPGGADFISPLDVNEDGSRVVGRASTTGEEAFLWTAAAGTVGLGDFTNPVEESRAWAIEGDLIVGFGTLSGDRIAAIWDSDLQIQRLDDWLTARGVVIPTGWVLRVPRDIRRVGDRVLICGSGRSPDGDVAAWFAKAPLSGPCNAADLAEPFDELNFSDVVAFLTGFGSMDPDADLAEPFGEWNFSDVVAFLTAFGAGCP